MTRLAFFFSFHIFFPFLVSASVQALRKSRGCQRMVAECPCALLGTVSISQGSRDVLWYPLPKQAGCLQDTAVGETEGLSQSMSGGASKGTPRLSCPALGKGWPAPSTSNRHCKTSVSSFSWAMSLPWVWSGVQGAGHSWTYLLWRFLGNPHSASLPLSLISSRHFRDSLLCPTNPWTWWHWAEECWELLATHLEGCTLGRVYWAPLLWPLPTIFPRAQKPKTWVMLYLEALFLSQLASVSVGLFAGKKEISSLLPKI